MSLIPTVGVPADRRIVGPHPFHIVGEKYLRAVVDGAGGLPLMIPALGRHIDRTHMLETMDGLLFTGSPSNVEPHHYGGPPSEEGTLHDPERDEMTLPLILQALDMGVPVLAVCRGFQEMNVALGGTLHQHVERVPGYHDHREDHEAPLEEQYAPAHPVHLVPGGYLAGLASGDDEPMVNSLHGQGIDRLAAGVTVEARADDGLIEAFTVDGARSFALGVQWHPEWQVVDNPFYLAIFRAFGEACLQRASHRRGDV